MDQPRGTKTILVVEDEHLLRELSVDELREAGYLVLEAPTAAAALDILDSGQSVCLVFTDVNMPGNIDGLQLAAYVRARWPQVRIIVTSGGGIVGPQDVAPPAQFIAKPYSLSSMIDAVKGMAGEPTATAPSG